MTAWVLMTAMPPTKGHLNLVRFAASLDSDTHVIVCTQPHEPFSTERFAALYFSFEGDRRVTVHNLHRELPQDPETPGFWELWENIMLGFGADTGDYYVTSEPYGQTLAQILNGHFMPYDPDRELYYTKATKIRDDVEKYFHDIAPDFQEHLRSNIVIFGAESTGKTTLSKELSYMLNGHWFFEWARPYLETVGPDITPESMEDIWKGQAAIQRHAFDFYDKPYAFFDTDLFSTIGYWEQPHWADILGPVPEGLIRDANALKADLYIITKSNIPFEEDPIRYGGDKRESPDDYWIGVAEKYNLPYVVLNQSDFTLRASWAAKYSREVAAEKAKLISFDRGGY